MLTSVLVSFQSPPLVSYSYAITVWYFDAKERAEAKEKYRLGKLLYTLSFPFFPGFMHCITSGYTWHNLILCVTNMLFLYCLCP